MERETPGQRPRPNYGHPHELWAPTGFVRAAADGRDGSADVRVQLEGIDLSGNDAHWRSVNSVHVVTRARAGPTCDAPSGAGRAYGGASAGPH